MKLLHRHLLTNKYKINQPIHQLMISDPLYDKDVWCRYENNEVNMNRMELFVRKDTLLHDVIEEPYDYRELIIQLSNDNYTTAESEQKIFEIGVDTARYIIQTEHDSIEIVTGADGDWGDVTEEYYQGKLGMVTICLAVPDEWIMSEENFIQDVLSVFNIKDPEMVVMMDKDMNEEVGLESYEEELKMVT